jgi:hypothetical protein
MRIYLTFCKIDLVTAALVVLYVVVCMYVVTVLQTKHPIVSIPDSLQERMHPPQVSPTKGR